jgi:hypothetical protein
MIEDRIRSVYEDDDEKLEDTLKEEIQLRIEIEALLEEKGFDMYAILGEDGLPEIELRKAL